MGSLHSLMAYMTDCIIVVSGFKSQHRYYVHFWTSALV